MYVSAYTGAANLLRHTEGATWVAIVVVRTNNINKMTYFNYTSKGLALHKKWPYFRQFKY